VRERLGGTWRARHGGGEGRVIERMRERETERESEERRKRGAGD